MVDLATLPLGDAVYMGAEGRGRQLPLHVRVSEGATEMQCTISRAWDHQGRALEEQRPSEVR